MGRKLKQSEKRLVILLAAGIIGCAYYFLIWVKTSEKIEAYKAENSILQIKYDDYQRKINRLGELKQELEENKNLSSYRDKFYTADENQEVYMDFLQGIIADNELTLESLAFVKERVELPAILENDAINQSGETLAAPAPVSTLDPIQLNAYFNVTTAITKFSVDYDAPDRLLNALDAIELSEKMVVINSLQIETVQKTSDLAANAEASNTKEFQCVAVIKFVSIVESDEFSASDNNASEESVSEESVPPEITIEVPVAPVGSE